MTLKEYFQSFQKVTINFTYIFYYLTTNTQKNDNLIVSLVQVSKKTLLEVQQICCFFFSFLFCFYALTSKTFACMRCEVVYLGTYNITKVYNIIISHTGYSRHRPMYMQPAGLSRMVNLPRLHKVGNSSNNSDASNELLTTCLATMASKPAINK